MKRYTILKLLWIVALLTGALALTLPASAQTTIVRCDPEISSAPYDGTITVDLYIENAVDLYGADVELSFDTTKANVVDYNPVANGIQLEPRYDLLASGFTVINSADNTAGTARYATTQIFPAPAVTGSGPIARIVFQGIAPGSLQPQFTYGKLGGEGGSDLPFVFGGCDITFGPIPTGISGVRMSADGTDADIQPATVVTLVLILASCSAALTYRRRVGLSR